MITNYHTHHTLCGHASGVSKRYVEAAIDLGLDTLGFSDHVPCEFPDGYISSYRMYPKETKIYVDDILNLKEEYKGKIEILLGYEAEYFPELLDSMLKNIRQYPCDYLLLGQHYTNNEYDGFYSGFRTCDRKTLSRYTDQIIEALQTELFSCIVHPDLLNFYGDDEFYKNEAFRLCEAAKKHQIPIELNLLGLTTHRAYPKDIFWEVASKVGNETIIGLDAHSPHAFTQEAVDLGIEYLNKFGITPIEKLKLKKVK